MAAESVRLFLSCVSDEFGVYRDALRKELTRPNVEVKIQEDFKALGGDTLEMLEDYIEQCEAVVHFLGDMTGSAPPASSVEDLLQRRPGLAAKLAKKGVGREALQTLSYTQWEAWLAICFGKDLLIVEPAPGADRSPKFAPTEDSRATQAAHRGRLTAIDRYPLPPFTSAYHLVAQIFGSAVIDALVKARTEIKVREGAFLLKTFAVGPAQDAATEPSLDWLDPSDAFENGQPNLFSLLRWDYRLVETLYGRDDDLRKILDWAESGSKTPSARLIAGEGGAGKTRLAAQAAQVLRDRGWTAGFLPRHRNAFNFAVRDRGLFLILDYPEEQPERTTAILKELAERKTAPYPLRVLLLSRRSFVEWEGETTLLQGRFGRQEIAAPAPLRIEDGTRLIEEAARRLAERAKTAMPDLRGAAAWLASSSLHRLPLYATAAAIYAALSPSEAFSLGGGDLLRKLAGRETDRVRPVSESLGLGRNGLEHLLALGVLADGLSEGAIRELARAGACEGSRSDFVSALAKSPWWKRGRLARLEPDAPAAAFVDLALFGADFPHGCDALPTWLFIALRENASSLGGRLGRVLYDLNGLGHKQDEGVHPLDQRLEDMLAEDPARAADFAAVAGTDVPFWAARFAARVALILANAAGEPEIKAHFYNSAAGYLSSLGRREEALAAAQEAVQIRRALAAARPEAFAPNLATSLSNLAVMLSELGRWEDALAAAHKAVQTHRALAAARPEAFTPDLAMSLNNLANGLSELGRREEALAVAQEAVQIRRALAAARPEAFTPDLAVSLNTLAVMLSKLRRREEALAAAREAADLFRALVVARPEAFTPDLAMSLNNLAPMLSELGRREEALAAAQEAVQIRRALAAARPEAFTHYLAGSLNNLANRLSELGRREEALAAAEEAAGLTGET